MSYTPIQTTLVIPTLNRQGDLSRCLHSVAGLETGFDEIVIVEQGDIEKTRDTISHYSDLNIRVLFHPIKSLSQARNIGVVESKGAFVFFIDDDTSLPRNYVATALSYFARNPAVVGITGRIVGPVQIRAEKRGYGAKLRWWCRFLLHVCLQEQTIKNKRRILYTGCNAGLTSMPGIRRYDRWFSKEHDVEWLSGCHFCVRRCVFEGGHWFDPKLIAWSWKEDVFFSYGLFLKYGKGALKYVPRFVLKHHESVEARLQHEHKVRMIIIYGFRFWYEMVYGGSRLKLALYIFHQVTLLLRIGRRSWRVLTTAVASYVFLMRNWRQIELGTVDYNGYIQK